MMTLMFCARHIRPKHRFKARGSRRRIGSAGSITVSRKMRAAYVRDMPVLVGQCFGHNQAALIPYQRGNSAQAGA